MHQPVHAFYYDAHDIEAQLNATSRRIQSPAQSAVASPYQLRSPSSSVPTTPDPFDPSHPELYWKSECQMLLDRIHYLEQTTAIPKIQDYYSRKHDALLPIYAILHDLQGQSMTLPQPVDECQEPVLSTAQITAPLADGPSEEDIHSAHSRDPATSTSRACRSPGTLLARDPRSLSKVKPRARWCADGVLSTSVRRSTRLASKQRMSGGHAAKVIKTPPSGQLGQHKRRRKGRH